MSERTAVDRTREHAPGYPKAGMRSVCGKDSFKARKNNFLFLCVVYKSHLLKVNLYAALPEAEALAAEHPDRYSLGSTGWLGVELPNADSFPSEVLKCRIEESYHLNAPKTLEAQPD